ncbi:MAG: PHP domain-containing protein, partial [Treponema sp.]|nr:PHP domain-containing protein [Treponema sp.]
MIDLHTHSNASDGDLNPSELIKKAVQTGITNLALTDHDTVSGLEEAQEAAKKWGISFIPGVELEIQTEIQGEFHLLGLNIRHLTEEFYGTLQNLAEIREQRNLKIIEKMHEAGIEVDYKEIKVKEIIGRPQFGAFLVGRKIVKNQEQAFKRWLGKGRPFYVPKEGLDLAKAIRLIHEAKGIAVLAHPMS